MINYKNLLSLYRELGPSEATQVLHEHVKAKEMNLADFDFGKLFVECFGYHWFDQCRRHPCEDGYLVNQIMTQALTEAEGAVTTAAFVNISGQFMYQTTLEAYNSEVNVFTPLIPEATASTLDGEKIPGVTEIGDEVAVRDEAMPYALAGVGEDWIYTPTIADRGIIVPVTWEALFNDKTGLVAKRAADVGKSLGLRREKLAIDCFIDENVTTHRYNWRGTMIQSYGNNSGNHTWDNLEASNGLVNWSDIDAAEQLLNGITEPYTAEPVDIMAKHLVVTKSLEATASYILNATEIRRTVPGYATSANPSQDVGPNPYKGKYQLITSRLLASRLATDTDWFLADIGQYAKCMMAEKMNVARAPSDSHDEFHRRIVQQYRANERFAYVVVQPRASIKNTA